MAWYNASWAKRVAVTLDNTGGATFTSGQVLVRLRSEFPGWASLNSDLSDIRVTSSDGTTLLSWWPVPGYSVAGNTADLWVNATVSAASSATIYIYYGNAGAADASSYSNTMSKLPALTASTLAAYQLDDGSGTSVADSSGNSITASLVGTPTWQGSDGGNYKNSGTPVAFSSGAHILFNGSSQYMTCGSVLDTWPTNGTLMFWMKRSATGTITGARVLSKFNKDDGTNYDGIDLFFDASNNLNARNFRSTGSGFATVTIISNVVTNDTVWHHVAITWGASGYRLYIDGVLVASNASTQVPRDTSTGVKPLTFGCYNSSDGAPSNFTNIYLDAVVVENVQHDAGWIRAAWSRMKYANPSLVNKVTRSASNPLISPTTEFSSTATAVFEPTVVLSTDTTQAVAFYTAGLGTTPYGIFRAHTAIGSFPASWTKDGLILGNGTGGEAGVICRPSIYVESGTWYLFYVDGITTGRLRWVSSTDDGVTWNSPTTLIATASAPSGATAFENSYIIKDGSTYHLFLECVFSTHPSYRLTRWTSSTLTGTYTYQATLSTLLVASGGSYDKGVVSRVNGQWHMIYHACTSVNLDIPCSLFHATLDGAISADSSWVQDPDGAFLAPQGVPSAEYDQVADPTLFETGGVAYILYDGDDNVGTYEAQIRATTFTGTLAGMLDGVPTPSIGSQELAPTSAYSPLPAILAGWGNV